MGLFEKKLKKPSDGELGEPLPLPAVVPAASSAPAQPAQPAAAAKPLKADHPDYGIKKAIELMRMLPNDNVELVVRVVKTTLESTNISVASIIKDATRKQTEIEGRVDTLKKEIVNLEAEIAKRRGEIAVFDADHKETSMVKERLVLAEKLTGDASAAEPRATSPTSPPATAQRPAGKPESTPPTGSAAS
jgi:hypothetical protein